jgi:hypothetical protein
VSHHPEEQLGPYLEGELGPEDRRAIELHLARCEACSVTLRELRTTVELLRLVPEPLAPAQLGRAVMDRIAAGERRPLARFRARLSSSMGSPITSAVGVLAAAALVILTLRAVSPAGAPWVASSLAPDPLPGSARVVERSPQVDERVALRSTPPLQAASLPRALPAPFRPRPERSGGMGVGAAAPGGAEILPPRPALARCQAFGRGADVDGDGPGFDCRPWLSGMLTLAQFDPQVFLGEISLLPGSERDAWLAELVGFAARSGSVTRVVAGLRSSVDAGAALLAERFERGTRTAAVE